MVRIKNKWFFAGLAVLIASLAFLEHKQPFYFTQDDNFAENLPVILQGCRSLLRGRLLDWSPYQFLGSPVAATGGYTLTYPPTFFSYLIARYTLGNELLTVDVFCILHLIVGYCVAYALLRRSSVDPALSSAGSLSFILSGYSLIAGRSWFTMTAVCVWLPLLFLSLNALVRKKTGWKWILGTGCALGFFYHAGHPQMWLYTVLFFLLSIVFFSLTRKITLYNAACAVPAFLCGLAIIMPLLIPQWSIISEVPRYPKSGGISFPGVLAMLFPFPFSRAPHPEIGMGTAFDQSHMAPLFYSGTLFQAVFFVTLAEGLVSMFRRKKRTTVKQVMTDNLWYICALIAFLMSLGKPGLLWTIHSRLPLLNKFTMSFKFLHFFNFFAALGGGIVLTRRLMKPPAKYIFLSALLSISVYALLLYHATTATASFYSYGDRPVYSRLPAAIEKTIGSTVNGRVLSLCPWRSPLPGYVFSLRHNFPSYFDVSSFSGYDPFIGNTPYYLEALGRLFISPREAARAYGVRWVVVDKDQQEGEIMMPLTRELAAIFTAQGIPRLTYAGYVFLELKEYRPTVYAKERPERALPFSVRHDGLDIDVSGIAVTGGRVVINTLWRPGVEIDSEKGKLTGTPDRWGRILVDIPPQTLRITFRYVPPWQAGLAGGLFCAAGSLLAGGLIKRYL